MFKAQDFQDKDGQAASPEAAAQIANKKIMEILKDFSESDAHEAVKYFRLTDILLGVKPWPRQ